MLLILKRLWITIVNIQLNEQYYAEYLWNSNFSLNITTSTLFFRSTNWVICKKKLRLMLKPKIMSFHLLNGSVNDGTFKKREKNGLCNLVCSKTRLSCIFWDLGVYCLGLCVSLIPKQFDSIVFIVYMQLVVLVPSPSRFIC